MAGHHKRKYTTQERESILKYIIRNKTYNGLKGKFLWKEMEKEEICRRTWQSMKEHFRRKIIPELRYFDISKDEKRKILAGFYGHRLEVERNSMDVCGSSTMKSHPILKREPKEEKIETSNSSDDKGFQPTCRIKRRRISSSSSSSDQFTNLFV